MIWGIAISDRTLRRLAWGIFALAFLVFAAILALAAMRWSELPPQFQSWQQWMLVPLGLTVPAVAVVIANRHPRLSIGWLLLLIGFFAAVAQFANFYAAVALGEGLPSKLPAGIWGLWLSQWVWTIPFILPPTLFLLLFPDGRLPAKVWRPIAWLAVVAVLTTIAVTSTLPLLPGPGDQQGSYPNPFPLTLQSLNRKQGAIQGVLLATFILLFLSSGASMIQRWLRADVVQRQQIKLFAYVMGLYVLAQSASLTQSLLQPGASGKVTEFLGDLVGLFIPIAIGVAILRYRLFDIDIVIRRTVVYGLLATFITAVYLGLVVGIGALVGNSGRSNLLLSLVATAIVAVAFQPVRQRAQRFADRIVYGKRATPYEVLSGFSERLAETESSEDLLDRMARVLAEGTAAERAEVWLRVGDQVRRISVWPATSESTAALPMRNGGLPLIEATRVVPVVHGGEPLGAITITKKRGESLTPVEDKLMTDLAAQAGLVLRNVGLAQQLRQRLDDLQASRQRLVTAQDEERRRIERNLHDGAQQQLIALQLKLGLVERQAEIDCKIRPALGQLKEDAEEALTNLRELARGIYPPLLAADGLGIALQAQARKSTVPVELHFDGVGRLQPEIEAAVYFCCLEAMQNVVKYASASQIDITVATAGNVLRFEIADDGKGFDPASITRSSGLQNMQDRVEVLGGQLAVKSAPGAGTRVTGSIPLAAAEAATARELSPATPSASPSRS